MAITTRYNNRQWLSRRLLTQTQDMEYDDLTLLDTALAISPDRPCDVSAVVRIPCYKVPNASPRIFLGELTYLKVFARRAENVNVSKPPARVRPGFWRTIHRITHISLSYTYNILHTEPGEVHLKPRNELTNV